MSEESIATDPYEMVLADLRARRDKLNATIEALEAARGSSPLAAAGSPAATTDGPGAFLGMSIVDATKKLLGAKRQPMRNPDIWTALKAGGLVMNSKEPANTIGSVLTRRFSEVGDVVRVGRGTWGLKEWYPNRSFKKETEKTESEPKNGTSAPEQPS